VRRHKNPADIIAAINGPDDYAGSGKDASDGYDRAFEAGNKKHRNILASFNHWYTIATHPFCVIIICVLFLAVTAITKYIGLFTGNKAFLQISADFFGVLTYIATAVVSSVFTKFIEKK
jgi:hypothetical protein